MVVVVNKNSKGIAQCVMLKELEKQWERVLDEERGAMKTKNDIDGNSTPKAPITSNANQVEKMGNNRGGEYVFVAGHRDEACDTEMGRLVKIPVLGPYASWLIELTKVPKSWK